MNTQTQEQGKYKHRKRITITLAGATEDDVEFAFSEVARLVKAGYLSGADHNETGGFYFGSTDQVPDSEVPA